MSTNPQTPRPTQKRGYKKPTLVRRETLAAIAAQIAPISGISDGAPG